MPIQNTLTKEIITIDVYKKRCELEDFFDEPRGGLRNLNASEIEQSYFNQFVNTDFYEQDI